MCIEPLHFNINSYSGGIDFTPVAPSTQLTFTSGSQRVCVDITLVDDAIAESEETFTAILSSNQERITLAANPALITILDNEGKLSFSL